jgi:hypothetical protein
MKSKVPAPSFSKGDLVKPVRDCITAWRRLTPEERNTWYEKFHADCREGKELPFDSAGEPRLAPQDTYFSLSAEDVLTVVRARVAAPAGYGTIKDCCQVFCPSNGETLYVSRRALINRW